MTRRERRFVCVGSLLLLFLIAGGCRSARPLKPRSRGPNDVHVRPVGVETRAREPDRLYFALYNAAGLPDGSYAIDVPSDWKDLPRRKGPRGIPQLQDLLYLEVSSTTIPARITNLPLIIDPRYFDVQPSKNVLKTYPYACSLAQRNPGKNGSAVIFVYGSHEGYDTWVFLGEVEVKKRHDSESLAFSF